LYCRCLGSARRACSEPGALLTSITGGVKIPVAADENQGWTGCIEGGNDVFLNSISSFLVICRYISYAFFYMFSSRLFVLFFSNKFKVSFCWVDTLIKQAQ
jgi:hypothetical protein